MGMLKRLLTKNHTEIPLLWVFFNEKHFKKHGKADSCMLYLHPLLRDDEVLKSMMNEMADHIRDNHDMTGM